MTDNAIEVHELGKMYQLGLRHGRHDTLVDLLADRVSRLFSRRKTQELDHGAEGTGEFWALRDVSFTIKKGERVGIIGLNGAGKSTLLKLISRITYPSSGYARIRGRVGALLEVGTGFHPELTGRENVFLYGTILGLSKLDIERKFDSIVEFAELSKFVNTPVKRYSSGMYVRLAFSVAAHLEPEILLLDEVLAVGDLPFQRKCIEFARSLKEKDATILFVSHNMFSIKSMCERVIYLKQGRIVFDGPTDQGLERYENDSGLTTLTWAQPEKGRLPVVIEKCELSDEDGNATKLIEFGKRLRIRIAYRSEHAIRNPNFIIALIRSDGVACCNYSSETDDRSPAEISGEGSFELTTPPLNLVSESYTISIIVREPGFQDIVGAQQGSTFHIKHDLFDTHFGVFHQEASWQFADGATAVRSPKQGALS